MSVILENLIGFSSWITAYGSGKFFQEWKPFLQLLHEFVVTVVSVRIDAAHNLHLTPIYAWQPDGHIRFALNYNKHYNIILTTFEHHGNYLELEQFI